MPRISWPAITLPPLPRLPRPQIHVPWRRLAAFGPLPFAVALVGAVAWYHFLFAGFSVTGGILDDSTGQAVSEARVWSTRASTTSAPDGSFVLDSVKPPDMIGIEAPGYRGTTIRLTTPFAPLAVRIVPIGLDIAAVDADNGEPIAALAGLPPEAKVLGPGAVRVSPVRPGQRFSLTADGYKPAEATYTGQDTLRIALQPKLGGRITDARTGSAVVGARISLGDTRLRTDADGSYELARRPVSGQLQVLAPGYRAQRVDVAQHPALDVQLQPNEVRGMYMTYFAIGGDDYRQEMFRMLDTTEVNAVVIDVKGDYGLLSYTSDVPLAKQIGADNEPTIQDVRALLRDLHQHGAYAIARIVVFKDNVLATHGARAGLDVGVKDRRNGQNWVDGEQLAWVDPFQSAAWDYNTALAREAIERGFDEVQFDYIRFPTDPSPSSTIGDIVYSQPMNESNRVSALKNFLQRAHQAVNDAGGFLSMDTFGYTTWWDDDGGIGQDLTILADNIDYYCPMVYPSTFNAGVPGLIPYPDVVNRPYDTVFESLKHVQQKLIGKAVVVRPWLQYFDDYPWAQKTRYDAPQIEAQKKAVIDARAQGWMFWNAGSLYKRGGLAPRS